MYWWVARRSEMLLIAILIVHRCRIPRRYSRVLPSKRRRHPWWYGWYSWQMR